jgi:hypothetical protein
MADVTSVDLAYDHAKDNLAAQRASLDNIRSRAATVITAASIVASFLGAQALADTMTVPGVAAPIDDRSVQLWEAIAFAAFLLLLGFTAWIISPKESWTFELDPAKILCQAKEIKLASLEAEGSIQEDEIARQLKPILVDSMAYNEKCNQKGITRRLTALRWSVGLLAVEAVAFMLDLTT